MKICRHSYVEKYRRSRVVVKQRHKYLRIVKLILSRVHSVTEIHFRSSPMKLGTQWAWDRACQETGEGMEGSLSPLPLSQGEGQRLKSIKSHVRGCFFYKLPVCQGMFSWGWGGVVFGCF